MWSIPLKAETKEEAYLFYMRAKTNDLFIDAESFDNDFSKYGEIALKIGAYEFAANLYWMLSEQAKTNSDPNFETYYFKFQYALNKVNPNLEFENRLKKQFKRLDKKLRKEMKRHPRYKKFKN